MTLVSNSENRTSNSSNIINLQLFKLQILQNKYSKQMKNLSFSIKSKCMTMVSMNVDEILKEIQKDDDLMTSIISTMELELQLKKEKDTYKTQTKADVE